MRKLILPMKKTLLSLFSMVVLFASCKKDDDPATFIQLQKFSDSQSGLNFQYNENHLPTKIEELQKEESALSVYTYTNITYENGVPVKAEKYKKREGNFVLDYSFAFTVDAQKRITKAVITRYSSNGQPLEGNFDRTYSFNNDGKLTKIVYDSDPEDPWIFEYDANGDIKESPYSNEGEGFKYTSNTTYKYDNGLNPFSVNGLGIFMMVIFDGDNLNADILLSNHLISTYKYESTEIYNRGAENETIATELETIAYTNTYDADGGLKKLDATRSRKSTSQGEVTNEYSEQYSYDVTCVKKNR